jgi:argininosuccinate lyase
MGAAALAGTSFPLDRTLIARLLGFDGLVEVSLDAVGSRDFALEVLCVCSLIASDLSRIAQDFIFYSSVEASLITLPDEFASTSSIMPQKKNPDPLELVRAKCAKIIGILGSGATTLHGLPSGYNLDFQEITPLLWQAIGELKSCLQIMTALVPGIRVDSAIAQRRYLEFTAATELANVLVREEKLPFRLAHRAVGSAVREALQQSKTLKDLRQEDWEKSLNRKINRRTFSLMARTLDLTKHLHVYRTKGSPNPEEMRSTISRRRLEYRALLKTNSRLRQSIQKSFRTLRKIAISI